MARPLPEARTRSAVPHGNDATARAQEDVPVARYGSKSRKTVESAMHRRKKGTLRSGRSGRKVTSRKQAIAIGLSEAREKGAKVPSRGKSSSSHSKSSHSRSSNAKRGTSHRSHSSKKRAA